MDISTDIRYLKGVGEKFAKKLHKLGIYTIQDLLYHTPRYYLDRRNVRKIKELGTIQSNHVLIEGTVKEVHLIPTRSIKILKAIIQDETGFCIAQWFNQAYLKNVITPGTKIIIAGTIKEHHHLPPIIINAEEYEIIDNSDDKTSYHFYRLAPVYRLTKGISNKKMRALVSEALKSFSGDFPNLFKQAFIEEKNILDMECTFKAIHFPENEQIKDKALYTLKYIEAFEWMFSALIKKQRRKKEITKFKFEISPQLDERIRKLFPFTFTSFQDKVISDIKKDLTSSHPMNRLIQGDVGSGKTAVALYAMLVAVANKTQSAIMAPTEILAEQHFKTISSILGNSKVRYCLLTSSVQRKQKMQSIKAIENGEIDLIIGTHALIQEGVKFKNLGLIVIDEQHRFGVMQRAMLRQKANKPHCLVMTATPIPRTLWLTLFGDLDISVIAGSPPGRKAVKSFVRTPQSLPAIFNFIRKKISEGRQAFFVYPLIEPSDKLPIRSATKMYEYLKNQVFTDLNVALLHGEMPAYEKAQIMEDFRTNKIQILVSTIVIEVGIDIPNANIMVVENAERYGLAQLHQLRGRISRSPNESYFIMISKTKDPQAMKRLNTIAETNDGFKIAEEDLKLRGPGEIFGTQQSGLPNFKFLDLVKDKQIFISAYKSVVELIRDRNKFQQSVEENFLQEIRQKFSMKINLAEIG